MGYAFNRLPKFFQIAPAADARSQMFFQHGHGIEGAGQTLLEYLKRQIWFLGFFGIPQSLDQRQVNLFQGTPLSAVGIGRLLNKIFQRIDSHRRVFLQAKLMLQGFGKVPVHIDAEIPAVAGAVKAVVWLPASVSQNTPRHVIQFGMGKQKSIQLFAVFGGRSSVSSLGLE